MLTPNILRPWRHVSRLVVHSWQWICLFSTVPLAMTPRRPVSAYSSASPCHASGLFGSTPVALWYAASAYITSIMKHLKVLARAWSNDPGLGIHWLNRGVIQHTCLYSWRPNAALPTNLWVARRQHMTQDDEGRSLPLCTASSDKECTSFPWLTQGLHSCWDSPSAPPCIQQGLHCNLSFLEPPWPASDAVAPATYPDSSTLKTSSNFPCTPECYLYLLVGSWRRFMDIAILKFQIIYTSRDTVHK